MKRFRSTLVFAVLVLGALFWALWDYDATESEKELTKERSKLFSLDKSKITEFSIIKADQTILLKKTNDQWRLNQPVDDVADQSSVDQYLNTLFDQTSEESIEEEGGVDEKIYGLHAPLGTIELKQNDDKTQSLVVGSVKAFDGKHYVKKTGESKIYSAASIWSSQIEKSAKDFREKKVFEGDKSAIESLEILTPKGHISLFKEGAQWKTKEFDFQLDANSINRFLDKLETLRASEFVSEDKMNVSDLKTFLLHDPKKLSSLKITTSKKETDTSAPEWTLIFGPSRDSKVYFMVSSRKSIMQFADATAQGFMVSLDDFRDKKEPFRFHSDYDQKVVETVELTAPDSTVVLKKKDDQWSVDPADKEVNVSAVNDLFTKMKNLEVAKFDLPAKMKKLQKKKSPKGYRLVLRGGGDETPLLDLQWGPSFKDSVDQELYEVRSNLFKQKFAVPVSLLDPLVRLELVKQKISKSSNDDETPNDGPKEVEEGHSHTNDESDVHNHEH